MNDSVDHLYWRLVVVRCQVGDGDAFEELVAQYQPRLRAYLAKMLPTRLNPDDVTQEVWMDVFRGLPRLADPGAFLPWLYRIAHNRAYRPLRRQRLPVTSIDDIDLAEPIDDSTNFTAEEIQGLHLAIEQLPPEHREVLLLRFMQEMSYEEIAVVAGCPIGTVRSRIHHAKRMLRGILRTGETS
jgi:RNA polymerase sigma-70 factor (ECF subfamily)